MKFLSLITAGTLAAVLSTVAQAGIVYNNGSPNQASGNEMTEWIQSEDFTLASATTITGVLFWSFDVGLADGSLSWIIYSDSAGTPGAVIGSGNTNAITRTAGASLFSGTEYMNEFFITPTALTAGTYHLGLHNGALSVTTRSEFYWETTGVQIGSFGLEDIAPFGVYGWNSNGQEHAFLLTSDESTVPEPGSIALLGIAAGMGLLLARRRKLL